MSHSPSYTDTDSDEELYSPNAPVTRIDSSSFIAYKDHILNDCYHHYYITSDWSPLFFKALAYEGFICVTHNEFLVPEIQVYYSVLDFPDLHIPKQTRKVIRKYTRPTDPNQPRLKCFVNKNSDLCVKRIQEYWADKNWLSDKYVQCMRECGLDVRTYEVYLDTPVASLSTAENTVYARLLIAGEIGYAIGGVYTSLTGYCEKKPEVKIADFIVSNTGCQTIVKASSVDSVNSVVSTLPSVNIPKDLARCGGSIQLSCLGRWLQISGFSFWNLGHPPRKVLMKYKRDIGAKVLHRNNFLARWRAARDLELLNESKENDFDFEHL